MRFILFPPEMRYEVENMVGYGWVYAPRRKKAPEKLRREIDKYGTGLIEVLRKKHVKAPPKSKKWNYLADIYSKWHAGCFYLYSKYACPGPNAIAPYFEDSFARLEYFGEGGKCELAFKRHTGQWIRVFSGSVGRCMMEIERNPLFTP